jgi:AraC-like DNA-binding protein
MNEYVVHIKNMVCPRCIMTIEDVLNGLQIAGYRVELGAVFFQAPLSPDTDREFKSRLRELGFEALEKGKSALISQIKTLLLQWVLNPKETPINTSAFLSDQLHHDYGYLSRLFSAVEGMTIEKYITRIKIEKVKELLIYDEMNLTEIADHLNYSSVAYLSAQFKKETGMTPTQFRQTLKPERRFLDNI